VFSRLSASPVLRRVAHRFGWGLADQAMSSVSNAAVSFYVAKELGATQFGAFSLAYVTYSFALNASRGLATDPLVVRYSNANQAEWRRAVAQSTGTAATVGLVAGACSLGVAMILHGTPRLAFLALGLALPGLLLQDSWRYAFFAVGRGGQAFLNDTVWTLSLLPALGLLRVSHHGTVLWFVLAWGLAAAVAACVGSLQARTVPRLSSAWTWVSATRDLGPRYLAENAANSASGQLRSYGVGIIAGLAAVGYLQAGLLLLGPFMVVLMGISLVTVPEAARVLRRSPRHLELYCLVVGVALAGMALAWGACLLVALPRGLGSLLLGGLWKPAYQLVIPLTLTIMGAGFQVGAAAGLHALGAARRSLRAMIISSVIALGLSLVGAFLGDALGATRGGAVAAWIGALLWWRYLRAGMRESGKVPGGRGWWPRRQDGHRASPAQVLTRGRETGARQPDPPTPPPGRAKRPEPRRLGR
jgi:O-antigen/teichoic acid export membrane protein